MNEFSQIPTLYYVYAVVLAIITYIIYQLSTKDYAESVELFQAIHAQTPPILINIKQGYTPNYIIIPINTEVKWVNLESGVYSVVGSNRGLFKSPPLRLNDEFTYKFTQDGTYDYHCSQFPQMKGVIKVVMSL